MTQREREQEVRRRLYRYAQYSREVAEYKDALLTGSQHRDESGVRGSSIPDPVARLGIALADLPRYLAEKERWIGAIDDAMCELREMDAGDTHGLAYICTHIYGLDGRRHKKRENRDTAVKVADECHLSIRALYYRLGVIHNVVIFHAAENGLFR